MLLTRWHGHLSMPSGPAIGYAAEAFWWPAVQVRRNGQPLYEIHDAEDPVGNARRLDRSPLIQPERNATSTRTTHSGSDHE
jgi:hypothetical protein